MTSHFNYCFFFFNDTATTEIYTLSLHDALPIYGDRIAAGGQTSRLPVEHELMGGRVQLEDDWSRSEEHTSELQSRLHLVCRLLLEKKKTTCCRHHTRETHTRRTSDVAQHQHAHS